MYKNITAIFILAILFFGTNAICKDRSEEEIVLKSAAGWLELIDNEEYAESWNAASNMFKETITSEKWEKSLSGVRKSLGKVLSRKMTGQKHHDSLPGAPDGSYFVIQYGTKFEKKKSAVETVTMTKEEDGRWKSAGYFIK